MRSITATLQVRMNSQRLPGKVLMPISGKPMLLYLINRLEKSRYIDKLIVCTTTNRSDNEIEKICNKNNIICFRGSENDVLERIYLAASKYNSKINLEFWGDSPLVDFRIIDKYIEFFEKNINDIDLLTNYLKTSFPPGFEFIMYKFKYLELAHKNIEKDNSLREHPGQCVLKQSIRKVNIEAPNELNYPDLYFEIDSIEDYDVIRKITKICELEYGEFFSILDLIKIANKNEGIVARNKNVRRKWKEFRKE